MDLRLNRILDLHLVIKVESYLKVIEGQVDLRLSWILDLHLVVKVKCYLKVMSVK